MFPLCRARRHAVLACLAGLVLAALAPLAAADPAVNPADIPAATPRQAAVSMLTAIQTRDAATARFLIAGADADLPASPALLNALTVEQFTIGNVIRPETADTGVETAEVHFGWTARLDLAVLLDGALAETRAGIAGAGVEAQARAEAVTRTLIEQMGAELQSALERDQQVMTLRLEDARWAVTQLVRPAAQVEHDGDGEGNGEEDPLAPRRDPVDRPGHLDPPEDECGGATPEELAIRVIEAWSDQNTDDLVWCTRPGPLRRGFRDQDTTMLECFNIRSYEVLRVWEKDDGAWVEWEWRVSFDTQKMAEHLEEQRVKPLEEAGADRREIRQAVAMVRQMVGNLEDMIEQRTHIMYVERHNGRWYMVNQAFVDQEPDDVEPRDAVLPEEDDDGDGDGDEFDPLAPQRGDVDRPDTPDEDECGGATPEELAVRVIEAWSDQDTDDLVWCTRPGPLRRGFRDQDTTMLECFDIRSYEVLRVWEKDDGAWIEWEWRVSFDTRKMAEHLEEQRVKPLEEAGADRREIRQAEAMVRQMVGNLEDMIEQRTHIMYVERHNGRWYMVNQAFVDQEPDDVEPRDAVLPEEDDDGEAEGHEDAPAEADCGGETPEEVAARLLDAWRRQDAEEIRWSTMPALREAIPGFFTVA